MNVQIKKLNISYIDEGEGTLVLFLHGWGCNKEIFNREVELLKGKYRVVAMDFPGFGESTEPKNSFCVDDYVEIVDEFINYILKNVEKKEVILVGHSYGGRVIIKLNAKEDKKYIILKNILIDAAGIKELLSIEKKLKQNMYKIGKIIYGLPFAKKIFGKSLEEYKASHGSEDYRKANPIMRETLVKSVNEDLTPILNKVKVPTLLIWGENDKATPLSDAKLMEKEMEDAGLVVLKNCGHFSFLEDRSTFVAVFKSFLNV